MNQILENASRIAFTPRFPVDFHEAQEAAPTDLFRERLDAIIDKEHNLIRLSGLMPWSAFDEAFGQHDRPPSCETNASAGCTI